MENIVVDSSPIRDLTFGYLEEQYSSATFDHPDMRFTKRGGTTQRGQEFEDLMVANLALEMTMDPEVVEFRMGSNVNRCGAFDDVVFEVDYQQHKKADYMMQVKHTDKKNNTLITEWFKNNKDFGLETYFKQYRDQPKKHSKLILSTNFVFQAKNHKIDIKSNDDVINVVVNKHQKEELFQKIDEKCLCYKFKVEKKNSKLAREYDLFFENFFLYTNHTNIEGVREKMCSKLCDTYGCKEESFRDYIDFVRKWSAQKGEKSKLTKSVIRHVLVLRLLSPYIQTLSFSPAEITPKRKILGKAILKFQVTLVEKAQVNDLKSLWSYTSEEPEDLTTLQKLNRRYIVTPENDQSVSANNPTAYTKLLWLMNKCPLIVPDNDSVRKTIALCRKRRFVLLFKDIPKCSFPVPVLKSLIDLKNFPAIYQECLQTFEYSMQGKEKKLPLKTLLDKNEKIAEIVTTKELVKLCDELTIGQSEQVPLPYIVRSLSKTIVSYEVLKKKLVDAVFVVSGINKSDLSSRGKVKVSDIKEFSNSSDRVFAIAGECTQRQLEVLGQRNYHLFKASEEGLEWMRSTCDVDSLQGHLLDDHEIKENKLSEYEEINSLHVICAEPGMGKTTLVKSLQAGSPSTTWTVVVFIRNYSKYLQDGAETFGSQIFSEIQTKSGAFDSEVLRALTEKGHVRLIWDGLDEVCEEHQDIVLGMVEKFATKGARQWITARNNLRKKLEKRFNVIARNLKKFTEEEQESFLGEDLHKRIKDAVQKFPFRDILGIPLYIYILKELIRQEPETCTRLLNGTFSTSELLQLFVEEQFNVYKKEKQNNKESNDVVNKIIDGYKKYRIGDYERTAMKIYFDKNLDVVERDDVVGILDGGRFIHGSLGDYFAASFLSKNLDTLSRFKEAFFEERCDNVRFLFDSILARDSPAHLAVLHRNLNVLRQHPVEFLRLKDGCGRSALHLACSWGTRCPVLPVERDGNRRSVDDSAVRDLSKPRPQHLAEFLADKCDPAEKDALFGMNCFAYSYRSLSLSSLAVLAVTHNVKSLEFKKHVETVLYYCVRFDYERVFDVVEEVPEVEVKNLGSLALLAVRHNSVKCLRKLLAKKLRRESDETLLDAACNNGHQAVVELLIEFGSSR